MEQAPLDSRGCSQALLRPPTSPEAAAVFHLFVTIMTFSVILSEALTFRVECLCVRVCVYVCLFGLGCAG